MAERSNVWLRWCALGVVIGASLTWAGYAWMGRGNGGERVAAHELARSAAETRAVADARTAAEAGNAAEIGVVREGVGGALAAARSGAGFADAGSRAERRAGQGFEGTRAGGTGDGRVARRSPLQGGGGSVEGRDLVSPGTGLPPDATNESDALVEPVPDESDELAASEDPEDVSVAADVAALISLEEAAARTAESLGLLTPAELRQRIDERVGSTTDTSFNQRLARSEARREILADAALVEDLLRSRYPEPEQSQEAERARAWLETLLPGWQTGFRAEKLAGISERLGP